VKELPTVAYDIPLPDGARLVDDGELLGELKREARRRGHYAFTMTSEDFSLYLMWFLGVLLGLTLASGRK
jgi:hypothetical protein